MSRRTDDLSRVRRARLEKLAALEERGVEPFAYSFDVTRHAAPSVAEFEESEGGEGEEGRGGARGAGAGRGAWSGSVRTERARLPTWRTTPAACRSTSGATWWARERTRFWTCWIWGTGSGWRGRSYRTRMGQVTVMAENFRLLGKSLRPLPLGKVEEDAGTGERVTHSGFADRESRYRQRYADLAVNPGVRQVFLTRTRIAHGHPPPPGRSRLRGGRDTGAATALWGRVGAAVRHAPPCAGPCPVPSHRRRTLPEASDRGRHGPGLRDLEGLPQRGDRPLPQPRVHDVGVLPGLRRLRGHDGAGGAAGGGGGRGRQREPTLHLPGNGDRLRAPLCARAVRGQPGRGDGGRPSRNAGGGATCAGGGDGGGGPRGCRTRQAPRQALRGAGSAVPSCNQPSSSTTQRN